MIPSFPEVSSRLNLSSHTLSFLLLNALFLLLFITVSCALVNIFEHSHLKILCLSNLSIIDYLVFY